MDEGNFPRPYEDVRQWLDLVEAMGELKHIKGADWNLEIGAMAELIYRERGGTIPALLFDRIKGYPEGFRILFGQHCSYRRLALAAGLPMDSVGLKLVSRFKEKLNMLQPIPPRIVKNGPILENKMAGDEIDLLKFPVPKVHELDGGRFIGTACIAVTRDPEDGWLNLGTYRAMVHDRNSMGLFMSSAGKHGRMHMEKYFKQGNPCPVVLCVGQDPLLLLAAGNPIELGYSEYDYCGGIRGRPFELVEGEIASKDSFIRETSRRMGRSASGSVTTVPRWKTRPCFGSNASTTVTTLFCVSRAPAGRQRITRSRRV